MGKRKGRKGGTWIDELGSWVQAFQIEIRVMNR